MSTKKILVSAAAGVAAGVALGMLFAPDKGANTRKKLSKKGGDLVNGVKNKFAGIKDEAEDVLEKGKSKAKDVIKDVKKA